MNNLYVLYKRERHGASCDNDRHYNLFIHPKKVEGQNYLGGNNKSKKSNFYFRMQFYRVGGIESQKIKKCSPHLIFLG